MPLGTGVAVGAPLAGATIAVTLFMALTTLTLAAVITDAANRIVTATAGGGIEDLPVNAMERMAMYRERALSLGGMLGGGE